MQRVLARRLLNLVPENKSGLERLIDKKRESYDLQTELDNKKIEHKTKMRQYEKKAEELEQKNLENQQRVVDNDQYILDNWNKRQREEERLKSEITLVDQKKAELNTLKEELERLTKEEAKIKKDLEECLPYKTYLDAVFEAAPEMVSSGSSNEVQGIVQKYKTMKEWRATLQVRLMRSKKELTKLREAVSIYDESSSNFACEIDYQIKCIAQMQDDAFKAFGRQRHEQEGQARQNRIKAEEAAVVRLAIENMFNKACNIEISKFRKKESKSDSLVEKFLFVQNLVTDLIDIEKTCRKNEAAAHTAK